MNHPGRGRPATTERGGCTRIPQDLALDSSQELEEKPGQMKKMKTREEEEEKVLRKMVAVQRTSQPFRGLTISKAARSKDKAATLHLFAGKDEGFTLSLAVKGASGDVQTLIELDQKRGPGHDLMG